MVGIKKIILIFFATIFVLQLSQVIKSTEAGGGTYVWTGASSNCANDGVTVCDFDDANNWTPPSTGGFPASPKDATEYFDVLIDGKGYNYTILATNPTGYKIFSLMVGYNAYKKRDIETYNPSGLGVKLTIQGNSHPDIDSLFIGDNSRLVFDTNVMVGPTWRDQATYYTLYVRSGSLLEIKKTFSTNNTFALFTSGNNAKVVIHEGATFNYLVPKEEPYNGNPFGFDTSDGYIDWDIAGTLKAHKSVCNRQFDIQQWSIKFSGQNGVLDCLDNQIYTWKLDATHTPGQSVEATIYNIGRQSYSFDISSHVTLNAYFSNTPINTVTYNYVRNGLIRLYSNSTLSFADYSEINFDDGGDVEFHADFQAGSAGKKRGGSGSFEMRWGAVFFYKDFVTYVNYPITMNNNTGCAVFFYGNVHAYVPFTFSIKGPVEIHQNYTNARLESLEGSSIFIGNGYINTDYPTKFVQGTLQINGATFNKPMILDAVSFVGRGTVNGDVNVTNSIEAETNVDILAGHQLLINGNLNVDKSNISVYASSNTDTGYVVVNGDVNLTSSTFKFRFNGSPPTSSKVYKLLTYTGTATGIPTNITLPTIDGVTLVYEHDTSSSPKQVVIYYTPPPSPPVDPPTEPTPQEGPVSPTPSNGPIAGTPNSANGLSVGFFMNCAVVISLSFALSI